MNKDLQNIFRALREIRTIGLELENRIEDLERLQSATNPKNTARVRFDNLTKSRRKLQVANEALRTSIGRLYTDNNVGTLPVDLDKQAQLNEQYEKENYPEKKTEESEEQYGQYPKELRDKLKGLDMRHFQRIDELLKLYKESPQVSESTKPHDDSGSTGNITKIPPTPNSSNDDMG